MNIFPKHRRGLGHVTLCHRSVTLISKSGMLVTWVIGNIVIVGMDEVIEKDRSAADNSCQ